MSNKFIGTLLDEKFSNIPESKEYEDLVGICGAILSTAFIGLIISTIFKSENSCLSRSENGESGLWFSRTNLINTRYPKTLIYYWEPEAVKIAKSQSG